MKVFVPEGGSFLRSRMLMHDGDKWVEVNGYAPNPPVPPALPLRQAAVRGRMGSPSGVSIPETGRTDRIWIPQPEGKDIENPVILFGNQSSTAMATFAASAEIGDQIIPWTWGGRNTVTLPPHTDTILSDPLPGTLPGGGFYLRVFVSSSNGIAPVSSGEGLFADRGEGRINGDSTLGGTIPVTTGAWPALPLGLLSSSYAGVAVGVLGSSSAAGSMDDFWVPGAGSWIPSGGFTDRGLMAAGVPWRNYSRGGDSFKSWNEVLTQGRYANLIGITHLLIQLGGNSMGNAARYVDVIRVSTWARELGVPYVWVTTQTPQSHSEDGWTTLEGQYRHESGGTDISQQVINWNEWLHDGAPAKGAQPQPAGAVGLGITRVGDPGHWLDGVVDSAKAVEAPQDASKWRVDLGPVASDYIHPNSLGHSLMGKVIQEWAESL